MDILHASDVWIKVMDGHTACRLCVGKGCRLCVGKGLGWTYCMQVVCGQRSWMDILHASDVWIKVLDGHTACRLCVDKGLGWTYCMQVMCG